MWLALVLRAKAIGLMVTGEAAGLAEEDREDIKLPLHMPEIGMHPVRTGLRNKI